MTISNGFGPVIFVGNYNLSRVDRLIVDSIGFVLYYRHRILSSAKRCPYFKIRSVIVSDAEPLEISKNSGGDITATDMNRDVSGRHSGPSAERRARVRFIIGKVKGEGVLSS